MTEVKFFSHLTRNIFLYFFVYVLFNLAFNFQASLSIFFYGLIAYTLGYAPVYFFNDFKDQREDLQKHKDNLYLALKDKLLFWSLFYALILVGLVLAWISSPVTFYLLIAIYLINFVYSSEPFRFRNQAWFGALTMLILNIIKVLQVSSYLHFPLAQLPLIVPLTGGLLAAAAGTIYKRDLRPNLTAEYTFIGLFILSGLVSLLTYPQLILFFTPFIVMLGYIALKFKQGNADGQFPIGIIQIIFAAYTLIIFLARLAFFANPRV